MTIFKPVIRYYIHTNKTEVTLFKCVGVLTHVFTVHESKPIASTKTLSNVQFPDNMRFISLNNKNLVTTQKTAITRYNIHIRLLISLRLREVKNLLSKLLV